MNKHSTKASIIIWSIVLGLVILLFIAFFFARGFYTTFFWGGNHWDEASSITIKEESIPESISKITIDWTLGDVRLYKSNEKEIKLIQKGQNKKVTAFSSDVSEDALSIQDDKKRSFFIFNLPKRSNLEIYLPQKVYDSFSFSSTFGNLNCDFLESNQLKIDSTSGDINLNGEFKESTFELTSGSIRCQDFKTDRLMVDVTSGDAVFEGSLKEIDSSATSGNMSFVTKTLLKEFKSDTTSGTTSLSIPENNGFTASIDKVSGDFFTDFNTSQANDTYVYKDGSAKIDVEMVSGRFTLHKN